MLSFIARRLALAVPTLILVSLFTFSLQKLLPGDPVLALAGEERSPRGAGDAPPQVPPRRPRGRCSTSTGSAACCTATSACR